MCKATVHILNLSKSLKEAKTGFNKKSLSKILVAVVTNGGSC